MHEETVEVEHGTMALRRTGTGPPVVLIHGLPGSGATWHAVAARLAPDHEVVVPDLLGFGSSSRPADPERLLAPAQARSLAQALSALGVERAAVVGHDFGGPVALALHEQRPGLATHLALFATNTFTDTPIPMPIRAVTWPVVGGAAGALLFSRPSLAMMVRTGAGRPRPRLDGRVYLGDRGQVRAMGAIFAASLRRLGELYAPAERTLAALDVPALVGWGDRDPFFDVEAGRRTAAAIRGATFRLYDGAGHFLPEERPAEVAADLASLFRG